MLLALHIFIFAFYVSAAVGTGEAEGATTNSISYQTGSDFRTGEKERNIITLDSLTVEKSHLIYLNADVNGSLNIARKFLQKSNVANDVSLKPVGIGFVMNPVRLNLDTTTSVACVNEFIINLQIESGKLLKKVNTF